MVIDNKILDNLTAQAKASPRLRMNLNFHQSLEEKCHRFLNAVEPGANMPIHRHPEKEESFVVLRGRIRVITYDDDGTIIENIVLNPSEGRYGVNVGKNVSTLWKPWSRVPSSSSARKAPMFSMRRKGYLQLIIDS